MPKTRYELDPYNRLVEIRILRKGAVIGLLQVMKAPSGVVKEELR